jgi:pimeloyl-ACP methyl ester carboxylesterase
MRRAIGTALLCFACFGVAWPTNAQPLVFPVLAVEAPVGAGVAVPCTAPDLVGQARCGVFRVPEDREGVGGRTLDIAFVVLEARDAGRRNDPIVLLPGGPGEALTPGAVPLSRQLPELRRHRDVLLVDVRGVGRSAPLSCDVPYPGGLASRFGAVFPVDHIASCRTALAARAQLDRYTTVAKIDDLEALRRWLGYDAFNLLGTSYGTRLAQVYLRRHPAAVRTVVMNGVAPVAEPLYVQHARLLQRALDRLLAECRTDTACSTAYPGLDTSLHQLLERFARGPQPVMVDGVRQQFTAGDLSYALRGLLYGRGADLPAMIAEAATGRLEPLARYYLERTGWVGGANGHAGHHFSVLCAEDIARTTDEDVARETAGTFMGAHLIESYRAACRAWPHARLPDAYFTPVSSDVPTLLLSGARDPVTPPEGAEAVAAHLSRHRHVVVPNGGHGVRGPCVDRMVAHLVMTGSLEGIDTSCVAAVPPTAFRLPPAQ